MSAAAPSNFQAIIGNTARALSSFGPSTRPEPEGEPSRRARTPLSLVVSAPAKRRAPFAVFCFLTLVAALMVVLVLNISVSSGQYQLVQLRNHQAELLKSNQDLAQQVQNAQAPQNLVSKATELGMVTSSSMGQIDLDTMTVSGNPKPATDADKPLAVIAPPAVNGTSTSGTSTAAGAAQAATPAPADAPAQDATGGAIAGDSLVPGEHVPGTATAPGGSGSAPVTAPGADPAQAPAAQTPAPAEDLHGGTIPAPKQKNG
ncbi:MAG TPA: hypothetical protein VGN49_06780 [Micrococcaceae bacterium]|jgi:cell division protein FtsL|nr:hypothetical protein [Micrococcaceae bacterium]